MDVTFDSIIGGGIRLVRTQPGVVAIWSFLYLLMMALMMAVMAPAMASMVAFQEQAAAAAAAGQVAPPAFPGQFFGRLIGVELIFGLLMLMLFAAVVRAVAQPVGDRFAYLRIGMDELRLFGLMLILLLAAFAAELVAILLLVIIGAVLALVIGKVVGIIVAVILGFSLFGAAIYAQVRLSLAGAFTVMRSRIVIKDAWRATKGRFWTLFTAYLVLGVVFVVILLVGVAISNPHLLSAYASGNPQAINAAAQEQMAQQAGGWSIGTVVQIIFNTIIGIFMVAIGFGAVATAALESQGEGHVGALEQTFQ